MNDTERYEEHLAYCKKHGIKPMKKPEWLKFQGRD